MKILICSILRNNESKMGRFISQINKFVNKLSNQHEFSISLYENDSTDATPEILKSLDLSVFKHNSVVSEKLNLPAFGSVVSEERVKNLAIARNKALLADDIYKTVDYVLFIDCDISYDDDFIPTLLNFGHSGITPDVYSGMCIVPRLPSDHNVYMDAQIPAKPGGLPTHSGVYRVYDTWGTRRYDHEEWGTWFPDAAQNPIARFWTTYNSVCLYNADPFKQGIRFDHNNLRLNKFDLEVAVVCEHFRTQGYDKIYINQELFCFHG